MRTFPLASTFALLSMISTTSLWTSVAQAEELIEQSWDVGLGVGVVSAPDYRGSRQYRHYTSPIPYVVYRGRFLRIDRDGLRGDFFRHERLELNISASATFTPESHKNPLREDMPGIYSTFEIGPAMNINLTQATFDEGWHLSLPLRSVISIGDAKPKAIGWVFNPQLVYRQKLNGWSLTYRTGVYYATRKYHAHYYSVTPVQASPNRPAFEAKGGYSGWGNQLALSRNTGDWWYGVFVRHDNLRNTQFIDSPLVESQEAITSGLALSRIFY